MKVQSTFFDKRCQYISASVLFIFQFEWPNKSLFSLFLYLLQLAEILMPEENFLLLFRSQETLRSSVEFMEVSQKALSAFVITKKYFTLLWVIKVTSPNESTLHRKIGVMTYWPSRLFHPMPQNNVWRCSIVLN